MCLHKIYMYNTDLTKNYSMSNNRSIVSNNSNSGYC